MPDPEKVGRPAAEAFGVELEALINRFTMEWQLSYAEAIGHLEVQKSRIVRECLDLEDDEDE